jgi:TetR/AcrR family transcriptional repressor of nem operon
VDLHAAELDRRLGQALAGGPAARLYAVADAIAMIQAGFEQRFGRIVGCPFGNLAAELSTTDEDLREHVAGVFARWEAALAQACRFAGERGALRDGVDPDRLAHMILAQAQGLILLAKVGGRPSGEIVEGLHALLAASIREGSIREGM